MHYKTNRVNHDFQIDAFLIGSCHTADAAYGLLCDLRDDRALALASARANASRIRWKFWEQRPGPEAIELYARNVAAAQAELAHIDKRIKALQPFRKYAHLPDAQAHEAAQQEEWKLELIHRAENALLMTGTIPIEQFATMRMHPEFGSAILPAINECRRLTQTAEGRQALLLGAEQKRLQLPGVTLPTIAPAETRVPAHVPVASSVVYFGMPRKNG